MKTVSIQDNLTKLVNLQNALLTPGSGKLDSLQVTEFKQIKRNVDVAIIKLVSAIEHWSPNKEEKEEDLKDVKVFITTIQNNSFVFYNTQHQIIVEALETSVSEGLSSIKEVELKHLKRKTLNILMNRFG